MQVQDRYFDAVTAVLDWDMPEDVYPDAINAQAYQLAGGEAEDDWSDCHFGVDVTVH